MTHACAMIWVVSSLLAATSGDVEIIVRDPDGKPVANRIVRVTEVALSSFHNLDAHKPREMTTDAEGRVRILVEVGLQRLNVRVAGVGFGGTGLFEARERSVARPELPRLARFARIEGEVEPVLVKPGLTVECIYSRFPRASLDDVSVPCDAEGRFVLEEVIPGELCLRLLQGQPHIVVTQHCLIAEPGQTRRDVVLGPPPSLDPKQKRQEQENLDDYNGKTSKEEITWVEGTVRNTRGIPLENAEVMANCVFSAGTSSYSDLRITHTDAKGYYLIRGPHSRLQDHFTVVARVSGRVPVLAYARTQGWDDNGPRGPLDLTIPDHGGTLAVRVLKDGKPAANVPVALFAQDLPGLGKRWNRETGDLRALYKPFYPVERTDKRGVARFTELYPCRYQLRTSLDGTGMRDYLLPGFEDVARAVVPAVTVAAGEELAITVALHSEPGAATLQALRPDGTPPGHRDVRILNSLRRTSATVSKEFDADGIGTLHFDNSGLWDVRLQFRETERPRIPNDWEPFYESSTLLPISPGYKLEAPVKLTCEPHPPGSIQARLVDLDGKPARGTILMLDPAHDAIDRAASTDEEGVARFTGLTTGSYRLRGSMEQFPPAYLPLGDGPLPDAANLHNQIVFPIQKVKVESGTETHVQLQPVKAGYVRGRITLPRGENASDYSLIVFGSLSIFQSGSRRDAARGETLYGPLLPGRLEVRLRRRISTTYSQDIAHFVTLAPGEVARLVLEAKGEPAQSDRQEQAILVSRNGLNTIEMPPEAMAGTVVHSDGKTPAFGAHAVLIVPKEDRSTYSAYSDAAGRLMWTGLWYMEGNSSAAPNPPGDVATPTVVVSLPGHAGAAVIPIDPKNHKPFRAVLPPPLNISGRVTLGDQAITSQNARLRVIAGHQGSGVLDGPLSVEAIVQADGRFTLRGLTPGFYQVQAARDGIWLSRSVTLEVAPNEKPADLTLDIPEPGAAVTLALVDDNDRPAGHRRLKIARPEGPFMDLWPDHFTTSADGTLTVRGLEVGVHQFRIDGENASRSFKVPSVAQGPARRLVILKPDSL